MNRKDIDAFIKKNIGTITLIGGVLGLIPVLMMYMSFGYGGLLGELFPWLMAVKPGVSFEFAAFDYLGGFYLLSGLGYSLFPILFYGIMIAAYFSLKNKTPLSYRLIRFVFSVIFISELIGILWMISAIIRGDDFFWPILSRPLGIVFNIAWAYVSFTILRSNLEPVDEFGSVPSLNNNNLAEVPKGTRFVHHLLDSFLYIGICSGIVVYFGDSFIYQIQYDASMSLGFLVVVLIARLMYYPIFETLFGATPGKFLTGSKVVNENGEKITFNQSLTRTFSRMVPFEPFSFLGKNKGWHDAWSKTKVVPNEESAGFGSDEPIDDFGGEF
jgi:hypothetical protein